MKNWFLEKGFDVTMEKSYTGSQIQLLRLFEKQYQEIISFATLSAHELQLSASALLRFQKKFPVSWIAAVQHGNVMNAMECASYLGVDYDELNEIWHICVNDGKYTKMDRGVFCAFIDVVDGKDPVFCINGFYPRMRQQYENSEASIHVFNVEWDNSMMSWEDFTLNTIGDTNPKLAVKDSLRGSIFADWRNLNLKYEPNIEDNGIHASSSAFEGLVERSIWFMTQIVKDPFALELVEASLPKQCVKEWCRNPVIKKKRLFEHFHGKGSAETIEIALQLYQEYTKGIV